jgi:DNA-binding Xre family transcriptional regulator
MTIRGFELMMLLRNKPYAELAIELGVSRQIVSMWGKSRKVPKNRLEEIAGILNCPVEYLNGEVGVKMLADELDKYIF